MTKMKKLVSLMLAALMLLSMMSVAGAATITINNSKSGHTYNAYQIFDGDLADGTLSNIIWGSGMQSGLDTNDEFVNAVKNLFTDWPKAKDENGEATENDVAFSAAQVADLLDTEDEAKNFADVISKYLASNPTKTTSDHTNNAYTLADLDAGYYLVKDAENTLDNAVNDAYTSYIIQVLGDEEISPKSAVPTVDKQVQDDETEIESDEWDETADHAINETFQFKLTATLDDDENYDQYEQYKVIFNDTMSNGITFEQIVSVKVDGIQITNYNCTATAGQTGGSWSLTISNIKSIGQVNLTDGATVEVIYSAHLNENAYVNSSTGETNVERNEENKNSVNLQYSNNPNVDGEEDLGKVPDDHVWVFTYDMTNVKYKNAVSSGNELSGAGFKLYGDINCQEESEIKLKKDGNYYRPIATGEEADEMTSAEGTGEFKIVGLDAGTYYLKETNTPDGYNTCDVIKIEITATHAEVTDQAKATTTITKKVDDKEATQNNVVNMSGAELPSTGGIGTTIFYAVGGLLVVLAVVLLVTKRRVSEDG